MYYVQNTRQLSAYVRALRQSRQLTQADLGAMLGVSAARVGKIEREPGAVTMEKFLEILQMLGARIALVTDPETALANHQADAAASGTDVTEPGRAEGEW